MDTLHDYHLQALVPSSYPRYRKAVSIVGVGKRSESILPTGDNLASQNEGENQAIVIATGFRDSNSDDHRRRPMVAINKTILEAEVFVHFAD